MNEKPGMAEDFVLNGNCQTTTDQTLKEQLCQQPVVLPQTGGDDIWLLLLIIATVLCTYGVMKHENKRKK
jgi:LPXTG-motif cell wall-anchored protein